MNERIKQLAEQMGWEEMGADLYGKSMDGCMTVHALKKLTELIVRECADVAVKFHLAHPYSVEYQIKKHFGVE